MDKIKEAVAAFGDWANLLWATVITGVVGLTADYTLVFKVLGFFLFLNVIDFYYGRKKAKETDTLSSKIGAHGIGKKVSYWVVILIAFCLSEIMIELAAKVGIDVDWIRLFGWFVLITYMLNELTSIVENLVILGYNVPDIFVRGLNAVKSVVDSAGNKTIPEDEDEENK